VGQGISTKSLKAPHPFSDMMQDMMQGMMQGMMQDMMEDMMQELVHPPPTHTHRSLALLVLINPPACCPGARHPTTLPACQLKTYMHVCHMTTTGV
jgi:hypothetical protein